MPQPHVFEAVLRAARRLPGYPKLRVLDLSAGRGEIAAALSRDGCAVRGTHFRADDYKLAGAPKPLPADAVPIDPDVDLTRPLPYPDAAFDLVILCEVAEHLSTEIPVVAEIGRVLAPSGHLVLSTPNVARLHSRWHFSLHGNAQAHSPPHRLGPLGRRPVRVPHQPDRLSPPPHAAPPVAA